MDTSTPFRSSLYSAPPRTMDAHGKSSPSFNLRYNRAVGPVGSTAPSQHGAGISASLRPQFQTLTEADVQMLDSRARLQEREARREAAIRQRAAHTCAQKQAEVDARAVRLQRHADRHAKVAGDCEVRRIFGEYQQMGRM